MSFRGTDAERRLALQVAYITVNPHPLGSKDQLDFAPGSEEYHAVHRQYHPTYRSILYQRNFYDIFMFDLRGNLIYSVYKELDYATNFEADGDGEWKDSGLGEAFRAARSAPDRINVVDWKPYGPSHGALASFLSTGVRDNSSRLIGIFCTQMPPDSKPINSRELLDGVLAKADATLDLSMLGNAQSGLPVPPTQAIADRLVVVNDAWARARALLTGGNSSGAAVALAAQAEGFTSSSGGLFHTFFEGAWTSANELEGAKIVVAGRQMALAQSMCRDVALLNLGVGAPQGLRSSIRWSMDAFERGRELLLNGNATSRTEMSDLVPRANTKIAALSRDVEAAWLLLQSTLGGIASGGNATELIVRAAVEQTGALVAPLEREFVEYSTVTRTTTIPPVQILAPIPLTGDWAAGRTMRVAALVAQDLINREQRLLPGYQLKTVFLDDRCDADTASKIMLGEMSKRSDYMALSGTGCSKVCAATAFTASTLKMPFLSYQCSDAKLSDTATYPDLVRLGTPTTEALDVIRRLGDGHSWTHVRVISGDPAKHRAEAEQLRDGLVGRGFRSDYTYAYDGDWEEIVQMMSRLQESTKGKDRVFFVVGTESYFRSLLCASIVVGARQGITWLSQGTWRQEWWKKSDALADTHADWLKEDAAGVQLQSALRDFKEAWDDLNATDDEERRVLLQSLYVTDEKDALYSVDGPELYHDAHRRWHSTFRDKLRARSYYDIFILDLSGNMVYSVYKELDYATNFAAGGIGQWRDSGLGDAYRAALARPGNISYIDWRPYGPSAGVPAAFLSTGIRSDAGELLGVYAIQLPPSYRRSIETVRPECSLQAMAAAYEGAVNVVGLGRPAAEHMSKPLACFAAHSASSFLSLLDRHLREGFPLGDESTMVKDPYYEIRAHAADATCVMAFMMQHLLSKGRSIQEIKSPTSEVYTEMLTFMRTRLDFQGASGRVRFVGNDRPAPLVVQQVQGGSVAEVGLVSENGTLSWTNGGPDGAAWTKEFEDPPVYFPWVVVHVGVPAVLCLLPTALALRTVFRLCARTRQAEQPSSAPGTLVSERSLESAV